MENLYEKYKRGRVRAPSFPADIEWLGIEARSLQSLKNRVILLDFWTFCCINCMHVLPDLKFLEEKYGSKLQVIGVHSAKFHHETQSEAILDAMIRYQINHPVVNDRKQEIWNSYAVNAWPTFMLIDPEGYVFGSLSGEGNREILDKIIGDTIAYYEGKIQWATETMVPQYRKIQSRFFFPSKIDIHPEGYLAVSETGKNRILILDEELAIQKIIGEGSYGWQDGDFSKASFKAPQGVKFYGNELFVADTENHLIRKCNLEEETVSTIIGNGEKEYNPMGRGKAKEVALNSPWDIEVAKDKLYIAMAGNHQIWEYDFNTKMVNSFIGTGGENIRDGAFEEALLAQTSSLSYDGRGILYFIDSETSSLRYAVLPQKEMTLLKEVELGQVKTLIGTGLFDFGKNIGSFEKTQLQHPLDAVYHKEKVFMADTYNHRVLVADLNANTVTILAEGFNEPSGLAVYKDFLYVADTNHGRIVKLSIQHL